MAYIKKNGEGPYPNKAGEYCGNYDPENTYLDYRDISDLERHKEWLSRMRFGCPRPSDTHTIQQMRDMGLVGLYLKEDDIHIYSKEYTVPTPPELMEPTKAKLGDNDEKP